MMGKEHLSELRMLLVDRRQKLVAYRQEHQSKWNKLQKTETDLFDQAAIDNLLAEMSQLDERRWREICEIDTALERIDDGEYGICESCEEYIGIERLKVLPFARLCVQCAQQQERFGSVRFKPQAPKKKPAAGGCRKILEEVIEAIEDDGRVSLEGLRVTCAEGQLQVSGTLSDEFEYDALLEVVDALGDAEAAFDIKLENPPVDEDAMEEEEESGAEAGTSFDAFAEACQEQGRDGRCARL